MICILLALVGVVLAAPKSKLVLHESRPIAIYESATLVDGGDKVLLASGRNIPKKANLLGK